MESRNQAASSKPAAQPAAPRQRRAGRKSVVFIVLLSLAVLGLLALDVAAGAFYLYTDYQYNKALESALDENYDDTQETLNTVLAFYKNADDLMTFAQAGEALKKGDYNNARFLIDRLSGAFVDSEDGAKLVGGVYKQAVELYQDGDYEAAAGTAGALDGYKDSTDYHVLAQAHLCKADNLNYHPDYEDLCGKLIALGGFEDAKKLSESDALLQYRMQGDWRNSDGNHVTLVWKADEKVWNISYDLPHNTGKYFKIEKQTCYFGSDSDGWQEAFKFEFPTENVMKVLCYKDNSTYELKKE